MRAVPIRRLLAKLAVIAVAASSTPALAAPRVDDVLLDAKRPVNIEKLAPDTAALALGRHLALALAELRPIEATQLAASWALSRDALRRRAVAEALEWEFALVGDSVMIDHLSRDGDATIRA